MEGFFSSRIAYNSCAELVQFWPTIHKPQDQTY